MASAEREPIMEPGGGAPSGAQGQTAETMYTVTKKRTLFVYACGDVIIRRHAVGLFIRRVNELCKWMSGGSVN